jgi:hypothetical protein
MAKAKTAFDGEWVRTSPMMSKRFGAGGSAASRALTIRRRRIIWSASTAANSLPTAIWSAIPDTIEPVPV